MTVLQLDLLHEIANTISVTAPPRVKRSLGHRPAWIRFWEKVDLSGDCWMWGASVGHNGYGQFTVLAKPFRAHRWAYQALVGRIPAGMQLDHTCHNAAKDCPSDETCPHRRCVNPAHLKLATARDNTLRGNTIAAGYAARTHCGAGHPFDITNTRYVRGRGGRARICRRCHATKTAEQRARRAR